MHRCANCGLRIPESLLAEPCRNCGSLSRDAVAGPRTVEATASVPRPGVAVRTVSHTTDALISRPRPAWTLGLVAFGYVLDWHPPTSENPYWLLTVSTKAGQTVDVALGDDPQVALWDVLLGLLPPEPEGS